MLNNNTTLFLLLISLVTFAQKATLNGVVLDKNNSPIPFVNVTLTTKGTTTNANGFYTLDIPANTNIKIKFSHLSYKTLSSEFNLKKGEIYEFNPVLKESTEQISSIIISSTTRGNVEGLTTITPKVLRTIKGAQPGIENILKTLPGVNISNELSTQYSVRGGNFDENLVYINEIEVYRPFLVRSGQQEGLSFVNTDLVKNVNFSAGGFQAKYGDKLSSVLDITYKDPLEFEGAIDVSLLGANLSTGIVSKNKKLKTIMGYRYRNNSLFLNSLETKSNVQPIFNDFQTYTSYTFSKKFKLDFLGNISNNKYLFQPQSRQTNFGTIDNPTALLVFYEGREQDNYRTYFGALKANYVINKKLTLKLITSSYHTNEKENYDILAQYNLGQVNSNIGDDSLGEVEFSEGVGSQLIHARNELDALITNIEQRGVYKSNDNDELLWSVKFTNEDIRDRLSEWEVIDSAGFSVRNPKNSTPNNQPYSPYEAQLEPFSNIRATNFTTINRLQSFIQYGKKLNLENGTEVYGNIGVRSHSWEVINKKEKSKIQTVISPRANLAIKPNWEKDILFRVSGGIYQQPPFYRELRDSTGAVNENVKAQKSYHIVAGSDYSFKMWDRPFKLTSEAFYKKLTNVNPYTLENVRIRYRAKNNAEAYAYGLDLRINGEFVANTESWFSFGYLKTEENIENRGYISRPTDQRLKFAALFQDYVPNMPDLKMFLNLVYNTGVPGGSPSYADPYNYQTRLNDYKRADIGINYLIVNPENTYNEKWKNKLKELQIGIEIYNIFDVQNSISNTWVRDVYSKRQYAIPNYLTPRLLNVRLSTRF